MAGVRKAQWEAVLVGNEAPSHLSDAAREAWAELVTDSENALMVRPSPILGMSLSDVEAITAYLGRSGEASII